MEKKYGVRSWISEAVGGGGGLTIMVGSEGQRGAKFSEEARPSRASCYVFL